MLDVPTFHSHNQKQRRFSVKKAVLKNFIIFAEKHLYWNLFSVKLQARAWNFIKKSSNTGVFQWIFRKFLEPIFKNICERLLLMWWLFLLDALILFFWIIRVLGTCYWLLKEEKNVRIWRQKTRDTRSGRCASILIYPLFGFNYVLNFLYIVFNEKSFNEKLLLTGNM